MKLEWRPAPVFAVLGLCAGVALAGAVVASRPELVAFAAPMIAVMAVAARTPPGGEVKIGEPVVNRCFEGEKITIRWEVNGPGEFELMAPTLIVDSLTTREGQIVAELHADRWGNYPLTLVNRSSTALWSATASLPAGTVRVYPYAHPERFQIPIGNLPRRIGTHLTRRPGSGVEFSGIRRFQPGDSMRMVNWVASARRMDLQINERLTERSADVAVIVDDYPEPTGPASEALERCVRGAVSTAQAALRRGDRASLVCLGGRSPRWLSPGSGRRQFYQVIDAVLASDRAHAMNGTLVPRAATPAGAVVVAFSPLLDTQFGLALMDLRRRGHPVLAVDVLDSAPFSDDLDPLIARIWRLERGELYRDLHSSGIEVVRWQP